jgi:nitroreductase
MNKDNRHTLSFGTSFAHLAENRRATRAFADEPIDEQQLESILETAGVAPSGYNLQPWRFVVVRDEKNRKNLARAAFGQKKIEEAPVVIVAFGRRKAWDEHIDQIFADAAAAGAISDSGLEDQKARAREFVSGLPIAVWLNRHVMIAFTHLMLAAEALGWETAPMEGFDPAKVVACLALPDDAEVVALLAVGRRKGEAPFPGRLAVTKYVYSENHDTPWRSHED